MAQQRKSPYTSLNVPTATRDEATALSIEQSAATGRRISMAAVVKAALAVAREHPDELTAKLSEPEPEEE